MYAGSHDDVADIDPIIDNDRVAVRTSPFLFHVARPSASPDRQSRQRACRPTGQCRCGNGHHRLVTLTAMCRSPWTPTASPAGGSVNPTLTSNVRVAGSACAATSRTRPHRQVMDGSSASRTVISRIARSLTKQSTRHVENRVAPIVPGDTHDHLPGLERLLPALLQPPIQFPGHPPEGSSRTRAALGC